MRGIVDPLLKLALSLENDVGSRVVAIATGIRVDDLIYDDLKVPLDRTRRAKGKKS